MSEHELWNELGNLYFLSGAYPQAVRAYNRSIEMDEAFGRPYSNLALTYVQQGRFDEAVDLYRRSIELLAENKDKAITWNRLGNVYRYLRNYQQALSAYRRADELDPEIGEAAEASGWISDPATKAGLPTQSPASARDQTDAQSTFDSRTIVDEAEVNPIAVATMDASTTWATGGPADYQQNVSDALDAGSLTVWADPDQHEDESGANWGLDPEAGTYDPGLEGEELTRWIPVPEEPRDLLDMALASTMPEYTDAAEAEDLIVEPFPFVEEEPQDEEARMVVFPFSVDEPVARPLEPDLTQNMAQALPTDSVLAGPDGLVELLLEPQVTAELEELPSSELEATALSGAQLDEVVNKTESEGLEAPASLPAERMAEPVQITALLPASSVTASRDRISEPVKPPARDIIVQELPVTEYRVAAGPEEQPKAAAPDQAPAVDETPADASQFPARLEPERDAEEMREIETGIAKFKRVVQVNPRNGHAWDSLGNLYKAAGQYKEALLAYQQAIANDPSRALYHHHLGLVYACEGRIEDAIDAFQRVIEIDPDHSLAHATLGGYYRKMGLEELAQKHVGKAMKSIFDSENEYNRACLAAICGNTDQALDLLQVALRNKQTYVDWILRDPDLDFIRQDPRFKQLVSDYAQ